MFLTLKKMNVAVECGYLCICKPEFDSRQSQKFSLLRIVQTGPMEQQVFYPMIWGLIPWDKAAEA
jgi:hypothetical protein